MANRPPNPPRNRGDVPPSDGNQSTSTRDQTEKSEFRKPTFYVNILTLAVIAVYTCFACSQVQETQTANSIAKKALAEANKPYVMFESFYPNYIIDPRDGKRHFHLGVKWTNFGNTPAQFARMFMCDPIVRPDVAEPEFHCNISDNIDQTPIGIIGPKQPAYIVGPVIEESDFEATRNEAKTIYLFGYVTYQDAIDTDRFGNPEQRVTRFCQRVVAPSIISTTQRPNAPAVTEVVNPPPGAPIVAVTGFGCRKFSCMDAGCGPLR